MKTKLVFLNKNDMTLLQYLLYLGIGFGSLFIGLCFSVNFELREFWNDVIN